MKRKKIDKKLVLNKETVAHLDSKTMDELRGGNSGLPCITPVLTEVLSCINSHCPNDSCIPINCK